MIKLSTDRTFSLFFWIVGVYTTAKYSGFLIFFATWILFFFAIRLWRRNMSFGEPMEEQKTFTEDQLIVVMKYMCRDCWNNVPMSKESDLLLSQHNHRTDDDPYYVTCDAYLLRRLMYSEDILWLTKQ